MVVSSSWSFLCDTGVAAILWRLCTYSLFSNLHPPRQSNRFGQSDLRVEAHGVHLVCGDILDQGLLGRPLAFISQRTVMALQLVDNRPTLRPTQEYARAGSFSLPESLS